MKVGVCVGRPREHSSNGLVCGRPKARRERSQLLFESTAFIDESGNEETPTFVLGGYVGLVNMWAAFLDDWQAALEKPPSIPSLHMSHLCGMKGDYEFLREHSDAKRIRREKISRMIAVVEKHRPKPWLVEIPTKDYREAFRVGREQPLDGKELTDYRTKSTLNAVSSSYLLYQVLKDNRNRSKQFSLQFIFDRHDQSGEAIKHAWDNEIMPHARPHLPHPTYLKPPIWASGDNKADYVPLQAADMLVWHSHRILNKGFDDPHEIDLVKNWKRLTYKPEPHVHKMSGSRLREFAANGWANGDQLE